MAGSAKHLIERHVGTWRCSLSVGTFEDEHAWEGETKKVCSPCVGLRGRMYLKLHGSVAAKSLKKHLRSVLGGSSALASRAPRLLAGTRGSDLGC